MNQTKLAGIAVGLNQPVRIMGVINVSPESFFKGSISTSARAIAEAARKMEVEGADFIDVGAMSTAPYLKTHIPEEEEAFRLSNAIHAIKRMCRIPVSADASRLTPVKAALDAGADILNDVTGLQADPRIHALLKKFRGLILMANPMVSLRKKGASPIQRVHEILLSSLRIAKDAGVPSDRIAVDPGIGFFRDQKISWHEWDIAILKDLAKLKTLKTPILIGVSRKSFIGRISGGEKPEERLAGSLAATAVAVINGASIVRTHDVKATSEAVRMAKILRG